MLSPEKISHLKFYFKVLFERKKYEKKIDSAFIDILSSECTS